MTQEEILEYNKKCAAFLGWDYNKFMDRWNEEDFQHEYSNTNSIDLKFHSDWNWIMEVKQSIKNLGFRISVLSNDVVTVSIYKDSLNEFESKESKCIIDVSHKDEKEAVVQAIYQFLKWYNDNTNK